MKPILIFLSTAILLCTVSLGALECDRFYSSGAGTSGQISVLINSSQDGRFWYPSYDISLDSDTTNVYLNQSGWRESWLRDPQHAYAGFKAGGASPLTIPIFFPDSGGTPSHHRFIPLESDPLGDNALGLTHLDILQTRVAFSETRLFYTLKCDTSTYPVSSGLTFYSYMGILTDPDADPGSNPIVYGLMNTVNAPGVITPGLYKILGPATSDLVYLGPLEVSVDAASGVLILSCALADLTADADFSAWFDPAYPRLATQAMTSRITLTSGNQVSDTTAGTDLLLLPKQINFANAHAPVLSGFQSTWNQGQLSVQVNYSDPDQNYAQYCLWSIDGASSQELYPVDFIGFDQPVTFAGGPVPCSEDWQEVNFSFINGETIYEYSFPNPNVASSDEVAAIQTLRLWPNPARGLLHVSKDSSAPLRIYNLRGRLLLETRLEGKSGELDVSGFAPGIYLLRQGGNEKRFIKL